MARFRIPGLQVPSDAQGEAFAFFNAIKERLELLSGEKGDPKQRVVTLSDLEDAGVVRTRVAAGRASVQAPSQTDGSSSAGGSGQLDFTSYPVVELAQATDNLSILVQGVTPADRFRVMLIDLLSLFARLDQESDFQFPLSLQADSYGFDIATAAPRFRMTELPENSDDEASRPADENIWEVEVDDSELSIYLVNDDEDARTQILRIARTGTNGDVLEILTDALEHNGSQVLTRADVRTAEVDVGSSPRFSGKFTLTDADIASTSKLLVTLAPGPYTGKGTLADEAEMYGGISFSADPTNGSATVYWGCPSRVRGNIKVNYILG